MRRARSLAVLLAAPAALAACPEKPPAASLLEDAPPVPPTDGPAGAPDGMPAIDAPGAIELGFPVPLSGTRTVNINELIGFPFRVRAGQAGRLVAWGVRAASGPAGTQVRMAIYSHAGANQPATLLTESGVWSLADGEHATPEVGLGEGDYWLLVTTSNPITIGRGTANPAESTECFRALMFTTAFPSPWSSGSCFAANPINVFIRVRPSA